MRTRLEKIAQRRPQVLSQTTNGGFASRNSYGAISYDQDGHLPKLLAFTQLLLNGEIWGVTKVFFRPYRGHIVMPMAAIESTIQRVLSDYVAIAKDSLKLALPYQIEMGAIGLSNVRLGLPQSRQGSLSSPILVPEFKKRLLLNDWGQSAQSALIDGFMDAVFDLSGEVRIKSTSIAS